ncbi:MAG: NAD-dependent epimerase/dehydratase family protein [Gammaproteobacteria bacterium]|nr:NAD-dependent epimerase/dehydratase family protein [Gammaproteobacteria bacterium]
MDREHILVTGGAGMIGSNLVKRLVATGYHVSVVDNLWRGHKEYLLQNGAYVINMERDFHEIDLAVPGALDPLLPGVDYVYHLAEIVAGIGYVFSNEGDIFHQNMLINSNTIASVRNNPVKGFIYVGTACSFPADKQTGVDAPPLVEEDQYPAYPESAYGWSKLMGEYETFLMEAETDIPVSVLVLHNVYGTPCDYSDKRGQVIPSLVRKAVQYPQEAFVIWGSGSQGRAFVHVNDVVDALVLTLQYGLGEGVIQIGPDVCTAIGEVAETIVEISAKNIDIEYDRSKPEGDRGRCADYSKARRLLNWQPRVELRPGLEALYAWINDRLTD